MNTIQRSSSKFIILCLLLLLEVSTAKTHDMPGHNPRRMLRTKLMNGIVDTSSSSLLLQQEIMNKEHEIPTSLNQIAFSTEIQLLELWEIETLFQQHEYVAFIHYPVPDDHALTGAKGVFTTKCKDDFGRNGEVFCIDGMDKCVSYEFLQNPTESGRAGYCYDFLPLQTELQEQMAAKEPTYALAIFQTCMDKNENCL